MGFFVDDAGQIIEMPSSEQVQQAVQEQPAEVQQAQQPGFNLIAPSYNVHQAPNEFIKWQFDDDPDIAALEHDWGGFVQDEQGKWVQEPGLHPIVPDKAGLKQLMQVYKSHTAGKKATLSNIDEKERNRLVRNLLVSTAVVLFDQGQEWHIRRESYRQILDTFESQAVLSLSGGLKAKGGYRASLMQTTIQSNTSESYQRDKPLQPQPRSGPLGWLSLGRS